MIVFTVLHIFRQVLFGAGNQGNHQNFDLSLLCFKCWLILIGMKPNFVGFVFEKKVKMAETHSFTDSTFISRKKPAQSIHSSLHPFIHDFLVALSCKHFSAYECSIFKCWRIDFWMHEKVVGGSLERPIIFLSGSQLAQRIKFSFKKKILEDSICWNTQFTMITTRPQIFRHSNIPVYILTKGNYEHCIETICSCIFLTFLKVVVLFVHTIY